MTVRVAVVQDVVPHYRVDFFRLLRERLADEGVGLELYYAGAPSPDEERLARVELPWATRVPRRALAPRARALYHPVLRATSDADLVVAEQANRMLENYVLLARQTFGGPPVAFWGHGANLQAGSSRRAKAAERWKTAWTRRAHWWFAYTEGSARRVVAQGFDRSRVTVVQNAVSTDAGTGPPVVREPFTAVHVGRLYDLKRLPFLVEAGDVVAEHVPEFRLNVVGDGPERATLERLAHARAWLSVVGAKYGEEKWAELRRASLHLMTGLVGLAVVDSFAAGTPPVVIDLPFHSPEVEYVSDGRNGLVLPRHVTPRDYGTAVADLLRDPARLARLREGARASARVYTVEAMSENFATGIVTCLSRGG